MENSFESDCSADFSNIVQLDGNITQSDENVTPPVMKKSYNFRNSLKGKKDELNSTLQKYNPDCVVLIETKLDDSYKNSEFFDNSKWK